MLNKAFCSFFGLGPKIQKSIFLKKKLFTNICQDDRICWKLDTIKSGKVHQVDKKPKTCINCSSWNFCFAADWLPASNWIASSARWKFQLEFFSLSRTWNLFRYTIYRRLIWVGFRCNNWQKDLPLICSISILWIFSIFVVSRFHRFPIVLNKFFMPQVRAEPSWKSLSQLLFV